MSNNSQSCPPPEFVGHMLRLRLTKDGKTVLLDPDGMESLTRHRSEEGTTVWRQRGDDYLYFIDAPYSVVESWVTAALEDDVSHTG